MSEFIKNYGIGATIILAACVLGVLDIGLIGGIAFSSKLLFLTIGIVFLIFYVPKLWDILKGIANKIMDWVKALFKTEEDGI